MSLNEKTLRNLNLIANKASIEVTQLSRRPSGVTANEIVPLLKKYLKETKVPEPLAAIFYTYLDVNGFTEHWRDSLKHGVSQLPMEGGGDLFRNQLADAILHQTVTPENYEKLTGQTFDAQQDLQKWLLELWEVLYGNKPVTFK